MSHKLGIRKSDEELPPEKKIKVRWKACGLLVKIGRIKIWVGY